jgi:DNA-directed RNA polymerase subunit RPC12/RpoP
METLRCPQCHAPLRASRFARSAQCTYCGSTVLLDEAAVSAARFRAAHAAWNAGTAARSAVAQVELGQQSWLLGPALRSRPGVTTHALRRVRWPPELAVLESFHGEHPDQRLDRQWQALRALTHVESAGQGPLAARLPQPVARGKVALGAGGELSAMVLRYAARADHDGQQVLALHPRGIDPRAAVWVWRRILETLAYVHGAGWVHGAVRPEHLLFQRGEHGVQLIGWSDASRWSDPGVAARHDPAAASAGADRTPADDVAASARTLFALLGGDAAAADPGARVPAPFAELLRAGAAGRPPSPAATRAARASAGGLAWAFREALGELARALWGPPAFCPIPLPPALPSAW